MTPLIVVITIIAYLFTTILIGYITSLNSNNASYFIGNRNFNWLIVAFSMIGACMSGITYISVPGMVEGASFSYLQMCLGFIVGYFIIAYILTPLFFKLNVISIYQYLQDRYGLTSYKTGAYFFIISKIIGASIKLFLVCISLQILVFDPLNIPFYINVSISVIISLLYTIKAGVKSIIWNDVVKTIIMISSIVLTIIYICKSLNLNFLDTTKVIKESEMSKIFFFNDINSKLYFWKQFIGGILIVVAMTGLDQDMMQRILSCKNYKDSQKNLISATFLQTAVIIIFLCLGIMLNIYAQAHNINVVGDKLFPTIAINSGLPTIIGILFILGLTACSYSACGSALTSLTTSFTIDILHVKDKNELEIKKLRYIIHICMAIAMFCIVMIFYKINDNSAIDTLYKIASYTYGPILGLFSFGILTKYKVKDKLVPIVAIVSPILCYIIQHKSEDWFNGYQFGYELLLVNAIITFIGLIIIKNSKKI